MTTRTVDKVISPPKAHYVGNGFYVHSFMPSFQIDVKRMSPFILLDYNAKINLEPSDISRGVGVHPHKGFETVTLAYKGKVEHHDNHGGGGIIGEGDVQWMTAANGILHKEYIEDEWNKQGGEFQMVQLWINLPAADKSSAPKYQSISKQSIKRVPLENGGGHIEVIAGSYRGIKGAASTFTPIELYNAKLNKGASVEFNFPADYNTALLVIEGGITINGTDTVSTDHFALLKNDGETFSITATDQAVVLVMSGSPIHEPIAAHGPFVMNTQSELIKAFEAFNRGEFGKLEE